MHNDPIARFHHEFERARAAEKIDITAMALATASKDGVPSVRYVLLKHVDERGFVFYTNRESRKGAELDANPHASLALLWPTIYVQVRVEGRVERVSDAESDAYFATRDRGSQLGAWASHQSRLLSGREVLEEALRDFDQRFQGQNVPRPPHWGGYRIAPARLEFWYGKESRLHEREVFLRDGTSWRRENLFP